MAGVKEYADEETQLDFHPDENVIFIKSKKPNNLKALKKLSDKIKNVLNVNSTKVEGGNSISLKLDEKSPPDLTHEYLQTLLGGGFEEVDAQDVGQDSAIDDAEDPQPPEPSPDPNASQEPQEPQQEVPQEGLMIEAFTRLYESSFLRESTYRTGQYWDQLVGAIGKGKQNINYLDILSSRKLYMKKKKSRTRNETLKAQDKAAKYFYRRLRREQGDEIAKDFMRKYRDIGTLTPSDYSDSSNDTSFESEINPEEAPGLDPKSIDFSDFFPQEDEDEEESTEEEIEKLAEPEKEEYPE